jgi:4-carboxymuconolactone decarboxylase
MLVSSLSLLRRSVSCRVEAEIPGRQVMANYYRSSFFTELYGDEYASELEQYLHDLDPDLNEVVQRLAYDGLWGRPGLSQRDKSLVTVAALVALYRPEQLPLHIRGYLTSGGTVDELSSIFIHLSGYCGFPPVLTAFRVLKEVMAQLSVSDARDESP